MEGTPGLLVDWPFREGPSVRRLSLWSLRRSPQGERVGVQLGGSASRARCFPTLAPRGSRQGVSVDVTSGKPRVSTPQTCSRDVRSHPGSRGRRRRKRVGSAVRACTAYERRFSRPVEPSLDPLQGPNAGRPVVQARRLVRLQRSTGASRSLTSTAGNGGRRWVAASSRFLIVPMSRVAFQGTPRGRGASLSPGDRPRL